MKHLKKLILLLFFVQISFAQNSDRTFESVVQKENHIEVNVNDGKYLIKFYSSKIVETTFIPKGQKFYKESHAVVLKPETINVKLTNSKESDFLTFYSEGLKVYIQKQPFQISYLYKGKQIISEKAGYSKIENGETIQFNLTQDEVLYGGGQEL